jgi:branched-chain amino acid transport system substrate-binding protein
VKKSMIVKGLATTAAVAVGVVGFAVPSQAADPGVSKTQIVIGSTSPQTGPASAGYLYIPQAAQAYFDYVNKNGGINGRKIKFVAKDDMYNPATTQAQTSALLLSDKIFAMYGAFGTDQHSTVIDTLNTRGVPDVFINTGASQFGNVKKYPTTIPYLPSYAVEAKAMAYYIQNTPSLSGLKRCFMYQDGDFGIDASNGFKAAGLDFTTTTSYAAANIAAGFASQVVKMKTAGCQLVTFFGITQATATLLGTSAKVGFAPTFMVTSVGSEPTIIKSLLGPAAPSLMNKMYTPSFLTPITDVGNPYVSQMKTLVEASGLPWNFFTYYGVNTAYVLAQAIKAAGPDLTRKGLLNALQTKASSFRSAAVVPLVVTATSHQGLTGYWMGQYDSAGTLGRLTDYVMLATSSPAGGATKAVYKQVGPTKKLLP